MDYEENEEHKLPPEPFPVMQLYNLAVDSMLSRSSRFYYEDDDDIKEFTQALHDLYLGCKSSGYLPEEVCEHIVAALTPSISDNDNEDKEECDANMAFAENSGLKGPFVKYAHLLKKEIESINSDLSIPEESDKSGEDIESEEDEQFSKNRHRIINILVDRLKKHKDEIKPKASPTLKGDKYASSYLNQKRVFEMMGEKGRVETEYTKACIYSISKTQKRKRIPNGMDGLVKKHN